MTDFIYVQPCEHPQLRHDTVKWVIDELHKDLERYGDDVVCLVYGMGVETTATASGYPRVAMWSKTGGYDDVKFITLCKAMIGMREAARKTNWSFLKSFRWWERWAFRLLVTMVYWVVGQFEIGKRNGAG